jgi:predicted nucleic acid-binding protein
MCIIIDVNVSSEFSGNTEDARVVLKHVVTKKLKIVTGGHLKREWSRTQLRKLLLEFVRSGRVVDYSDEQIAEGLRKLPMGEVRSNDHHILGLARISGARILYSRDQLLHVDFKNQRLIPGERGKIYQGSVHERVLSEVECKCH